MGTTMETIMGIIMGITIETIIGIRIGIGISQGIHSTTIMEITIIIMMTQEGAHCQHITDEEETPLPFLDQWR